MKSEVLQVTNLKVVVENREVLHDISMTFDSGSVHAIMGPNGSGKSTLVSAIAGHHSYTILGGSKIVLGKKDITDMSAEIRAQSGIFLSFQNPISVPGVSVKDLLRVSYQSMYGSKEDTSKTASTQNPALSRRWVAGISIVDFNAKIQKFAKMLRIPEELTRRGIHDGFSGGEKKKIEMLEALVLSPKIVMLDEIDTGLDVDALKLISKGIGILRESGSTIIMVTHYQRLLKYITPDTVSVLIDGKIYKSGGPELAREIDKSGYLTYK